MKSSQARAMARRASRLLRGVEAALPQPSARDALERAWADLALARERAEAAAERAAGARGRSRRALAEALKEASLRMEARSGGAEAEEAMSAAEAALRAVGGRPA